MRKKLTEGERKERKREKSRQWRRENQERARECCRRWRAANPERARESVRRWQAGNPGAANKWREANPDLAAESTRKWRAAHRDQAKETARKWREVNRDHVVAYSRQWREANSVHVKESKGEWDRANLDRGRVYQANRRARKLNNGGSFTDLEWAALCEKHRNRCLRCGVGGRLTVDHVIPLSKGGGSDIGNLQPLCFSCNASKRDKSTDYRPVDQVDIAI